MKQYFIHTAVIALFSLSAIFTSGCKKEDNPADAPPALEHAPPTTIVVTLTNAATGEITTATARDTTVVKGKPAVEGTLALKAGAVYTGKITLYDESKTPAENVTGEIEEEKDGHIFVFTVKNGIPAGRIVIGDLDKDSKGSNVGLTFKITVASGAAASGMLNVVLHHHDSGNKNDNLFDIDVDQNLPLTIQ